MDYKSLNNVQSVSPKDHACEIRLKLALGFKRRYHFKKLWTEERW